MKPSESRLESTRSFSLKALAFAAAVIILSGCGLWSFWYWYRSRSATEQFSTTAAVKVRFYDDSDGREQMIVENGSRNLFVVEKGAFGSTDAIMHGSWLLYFVADWNTNEFQHIRHVSHAADDLSGQAKVGIVRYDEYRELPDMYPGFDPHPSQLPLWLVLTDGSVRGEAHSYLSRSEIVEFVRRSLGRK